MWRSEREGIRAAVSDATVATTSVRAEGLIAAERLTLTGPASAGTPARLDAMVRNGLIILDPRNLNPMRCTPTCA